jgi:hypothetical protein
MANSYVIVPPDSTGKKVAAFEKTESAQVVQVQKVMLAGQTPDDDVLPITSAPAGTERAIPVRNIPSGTQAVSHAAASQADGHSATLGATADLDTANTVIGRLKKLVSLLPSALVGDRLKVDGSGVTQPVSAASLPLPTGAATEATLGARLSEADFDTKIGSLTETAPATDTASSGLNGRLQRIAQRLTTLLAGGLPAALGANGGLKIEGVASGTAVQVSGAVTANPGAGDFNLAPSHTRNEAFKESACIGAEFDDTSPTLATEDNVSPVRMTEHRALLVNLRNSTGGEIGGAGAGVATQGDIAHGTADTTKPVAVGHLAVAHGSSPSAVAAAARVRGIANRHGLPFVVGGHPNTVTREYRRTDAGTDTAIVTASAGQKIIVTKCSALVSKAVSATQVGVRVGFGAATLPGEPATGATADGLVLSHDGIAPGSGVVEGNGSGIIGIGADGEDLRCTSDAPTSGELRVVVTYYIVES